MNTRTRHRIIAVSAITLVAHVALGAGVVGAQTSKPAAGDEITWTECLVLERVGRYGRAAVHTDAVEARIVAGTWAAPQAGDTVTAPDGDAKTWQAVRFGDDGWLNHGALRGGYATVSATVDSDRVMILEASGHGTVYINGEPRAGDPYRTGFVRLPVRLRKGDNHLLFHCRRGGLRAKLVPPRKPIALDLRDGTVPDLIAGREATSVMTVMVDNATTGALAGLMIRATCEGITTTTPVGPVLPLSVRKAAVRFSAPAFRGVNKAEVRLELLRGSGGDATVIDAVTRSLRVRRPDQSHKRTFVSRIDGSVQYYAVQPAVKRTGDQTSPALVLTLHGAGVEAMGQADSYASKPWTHIVAPTNRRPYGFDWEDWGRLDAMEVLEIARRELKTDPRRTYLTGHSMGGHGTWHLGVTFPDRFAAIGPSAGWISFQSYAGAAKYEDAAPIEGVLARATSASDTLGLADNLSHHGVYILHGDKDDNVPVDQARTMRRRLAEFHRDFAWHEQPGAGHWWNASDEPGTDCVDWAPMFDLFARRSIPPADAVRDVRFTTANPGISAWCHWLGIVGQEVCLKPSSVDIRLDPHRRRFVGTTDNVARLALEPAGLTPGKPLHVHLDGQKLNDVPWPAGQRAIHLARDGEQWAVTPPPPLSHKGPHRYGPFKDAFRHRVMFVYGTAGTADENAWAFAKARYDAETFHYRGNASIDVIADAAFDPRREPDRSVILYGNADTHAAWPALLADSPLTVSRGRIVIGGRRLDGDDLGCLFIRPRPGSDVACVGVVSGTGPAGMRLTDRLPYFVSGVGYPDYFVVCPEVLSAGTAGIRAAGFFGLDWSIKTMEARPAAD